MVLTIAEVYTSIQGESTHTGRPCVFVRLTACDLRCQDKLTLTTNRMVQGRNCLEVGGVWIDDGYKADTKSVTVRAQSDAYFRILEKQPEVKDVYRLGNNLVWVTPSGTALIVDTANGKEELDDKAIEALFVAKK